MGYPTNKHSSLLQKLHLTAEESSTAMETQGVQNHDSMSNACCNCIDNHHSYKVYRPKCDFPSFDGDDVYKWLYKYNQYFEIRFKMLINLCCEPII